MPAFPSGAGWKQQPNKKAACIHAAFFMREQYPAIRTGNKNLQTFRKLGRKRAMLA